MTEIGKRSDNLYYLLDLIHKEVNNKNCRGMRLRRIENCLYSSPPKKSAPAEETVTAGVGLVLT